MSCGDPHDTDCADVLERMVFFIDNELDRRRLRRRSSSTSTTARPCLDNYDLERAVKALVARSCSERAPEELREKVLVRSARCT